jgi:hypothetical protein
MSKTSHVVTEKPGSDDESVTTPPPTHDQPYNRRLK